MTPNIPNENIDHGSAKKRPVLGRIKPPVCLHTTTSGLALPHVDSVSALKDPLILYFVMLGKLFGMRQARA
jgi:hypothetical protein